MKVKIITLIVLLVSVALSCKKEDVMIPDMVRVPLIKGVRAADQPQFEYVYNSLRLVREERSKYSYSNYNYNKQNLLETTDYYINQALLRPDNSLQESALNQQGLLNLVNTELGGTIRFEYNASGQLVKAVTIRPSEGTTEYSEYRYDATGRIGREILYWANNVLGYIDFLYDDRGNVVSEALYSISSSGIAELNTTTQYEFDNKQNPFRSIQRLLEPGINTNPNNITKEIYTIHQSKDVIKDIVQVTSISYVYNSQGFPVRKNGTVEYIYE